MKTEWGICPMCSSKTRTKIRPGTVLENFLPHRLNAKRDAGQHQKLHTQVIQEADA